MAQNDFVVANADGATVRADINSALQALATLSSGAAAPGTTCAGMIWGDTTNLVAKQRNQANTAWRVIATLDEDLVIDKTGDYSALLRDFGKTIRADGSGNPRHGLTVRLPAAATAGDGYTITVVNVGATATITVDGNGAETVNGAANHTLGNQYDAATYRCDGAVWEVVGEASDTTTADAIVSTTSVTNAAALTITSGLTSDGDVYTITLTGIVSFSNVVDLQVTVDVGNSPQWETGAADYARGVHAHSDNGTNRWSPTHQADSRDSAMDLTATSLNNFGSAAGQYGHGWVKVYKPAAGNKVIFTWSIFLFRANLGTLSRHDGLGAYIGSNSAVTGIRFAMSAGNITAKASMKREAA